MPSAASEVLRIRCRDRRYSSVEDSYLGIASEPRSDFTPSEHQVESGVAGQVRDKTSRPRPLCFRTLTRLVPWFESRRAHQKLADRGVRLDDAGWVAHKPRYQRWDCIERRLRERNAAERSWNARFIREASLLLGLR